MQVRAAESVVVLTLDRPEKRNALSEQMHRDLLDALSDVGANPDLRAVVITGAGSAFCAGFDLDETADASRAEDLLTLS